MTETARAICRGKGVAVIIPCYNEAVTIGKVVDDFRRVLPEAAVYVYDNNSSDGTGDIARAHGATVEVERRQGKGNVVRQMMRDIDAEAYLMVDGDCLCQAGNEQSGTRNLSSLADGLVKRSPSRASAPHPCGGSIPRTR